MFLWILPATNKPRPAILLTVEDESVYTAVTSKIFIPRLFYPFSRMHLTTLRPTASFSITIKNRLLTETSSLYEMKQQILLFL